MVDINKPVENIELIRAIEKLKNQQNSENEYELFTELIKANLLVPVLKNKDMSNRNENEVLTQDIEISIQDIQNPKGERYIPIFTDWSELKKSKFESPVDALVFTYNDYKKVIIERKSKWMGVVINPYTHNIILGVEQFRYIDESMSKIKKGESVMIGEPKEYPEILMEKLNDILLSMEQVKQAYFLLMIKNKVHKSYLLILDIDGESEKIFSRVGDEVSKYLKKEEIVDFVLYNTTFGKSASENQKPFYTK